MNKKKILILLVIVFFIELLFNIDNLSYMLGNYKEKKININQLQVDGLKQESYSFYVTENNPSIEIKGINKKVANVYLNMRSIDNNENIKTKIDYTDEMFSTYTRYTENEFSKHNKKLTNCHFYGKLKNLKITFNIEKNNIININEITINKINNISFNILRMIIIYILGLIFMYVYNNKYISFYDSKNKKQKKIIKVMLLIIITGFVFLYINNRTSFQTDSELVNITYSNSYTDSIIKGHFYLDEKPPKEFKNNHNVYDYSYRGTKGLWDTVYYKGKYYVYFGVLPQLILFVPFKLLTGNYLSIGFVTFILQILSIIMIFKFYKEIINKFFKKVPFIYYLLGLIFFIVSSRFIDELYSYNIYQMISISAFALSIQGLYFILKYDRTNKNKYLLMSTLSLVFAVSCRPPSLFISTLIIPIIIKKIKEKRFNKINILSLILPYLVVGILLMIFNYIRFGNILEFGFKYQLTIADYTKITKSYFNILVGLFYYLLAPLNVIPYYPFLTNMNINYFTGYIFSEDIKYSIMSTIMPLILFTIPFIKNKLKKNKELWLTIKYMIILGLFLIMFESLVAGITFRYMIDFVFLFNITSILVSIFIYSNIKEKKYQINFIRISSICIMLSIIIQLVLIFN